MTAVSEEILEEFNNLITLFVSLLLYSFIVIIILFSLGKIIK